MKIKEFTEWLRRAGAEILTSTNPYELIRFRARGAVNIVYTGRRGTRITGFAAECYQAFESGRKVDMGIKKTPRSGPSRYVKNSLLERDGRGCFFCLNDMLDDDISVEHLVSISKGGPHHQDNMALAHIACNQKVDNLPLVRKIEMRVNAVAAKAVQAAALIINGAVAA